MLFPRTELETFFSDAAQIGGGISLPYRANWRWEAMADVALWNGEEESSSRQFSFWHVRLASGLALPLFNRKSNRTREELKDSIQKPVQEHFKDRLNLTLRSGVALHAIRGRGESPEADHHWFYQDGESEFGWYAGVALPVRITSHWQLSPEFRCDFVFTSPKVSRLNGLTLALGYFY
jgi:hypothetical protein